MLEDRDAVGHTGRLYDFSRCVKKNMKRRSLETHVCGEAGLPAL